MPLEIHPSIGIARLGTSKQFFIGPEPDGAPPASYRDPHGSLLRQAARFRVFDCVRDANGVLTSTTEITPALGTITWTVHMVNRKGSGLVFSPPSGAFRNNATGNDVTDAGLIIDPGSKTVSGISQGPVALSGGAFMGTPVPLGDIRTGPDGRLIVAGGFGTSDSVPPQPNASVALDQNFADHDNWFDDTSDGPILASVLLAAGGTPIDAKPSWVIVAPPDFAPPITNIVTLYDVAMQAAVTAGFRAVPARTSFRLHIQPILERACGYQWVNQRNRLGHTGIKHGNFVHNLAALAVNSPPPAEGTVMLQRVRNPQTPGINPTASSAQWMPRLHDETDSSAVLMLTPLQYKALQDWSTGAFDSDFGQPLPSEQLPDALDRVALEACAGAAFFPGIECGSIIKGNVYSEAFRLDPSKLKPGKITQGNALPWQSDFLDCAWDGSLGWWPAQRPDQVLTDASPNAPVDWIRGLNSVGTPTAQDMVEHWHQLGIVAPAKDTSGNVVFHETERTLP